MKQCHEIARRIGDAQGEENSLGTMGSVYISLGEYPKAIELFEQHLEIARRIGDVRGEGNALGNMGLAYADLGEDKKAKKYFKTAIDLFRRLNLNHMVIKLKQLANSVGLKI